MRGILLSVTDPFAMPPKAESVRTLRSVVLPAPEGPRIAHTLPEVTLPVMPERMKGWWVRESTSNEMLAKERRLVWDSERLRRGTEGAMAGAGPAATGASTQHWSEPKWLRMNDCAEDDEEGKEEEGDIYEEEERRTKGKRGGLHPQRGQTTAR